MRCPGSPPHRRGPSARLSLGAPSAPRGTLSHDLPTGARCPHEGVAPGGGPLYRRVPPARRAPPQSSSLSGPRTAGRSRWLLLRSRPGSFPRRKLSSPHEGLAPRGRVCEGPPPFRPPLARLSGFLALPGVCPSCRRPTFSYPRPAEHQGRGLRGGRPLRCCPPRCQPRSGPACQGGSVAAAILSGSSSRAAARPLIDAGHPRLSRRRRHSPPPVPGRTSWEPHAVPQAHGHAARDAETPSSAPPAPPLSRPASSRGAQRVSCRFASCQPSPGPTPVPGGASFPPPLPPATLATGSPALGLP